MPKTVVTTGAEIGPYSGAVVAGDTCYVSGTGGFLPGTTTLPETIELEIRQSLENLRSVVSSAGFGMDEVVSVTCYLRDVDDWPLLNEIYAEYFTGEPPARAAVVVKELPAESNVEISCIAWRGARA
jgi:2-iminobutanoate/2-iminopropanoate deaminase